VTSVLARGNCSLHVGVCCKSLASKVLKWSEKLDIHGVHTTEHTCDWVVVLWLGGYGPPSLQSQSGATDFHCFVSCKICNTCWHEAIYLLATDSDTSFFCVGMHVLVAWWDRHLKANDNYVKVWCILSATYVPCEHSSYNKVLGISVFTVFLNNFEYIKWNNINLGLDTPLKLTSSKFGQEKKRKSLIHYVTELCDSFPTCVRECLCRLCFWENSLLHTLQIYCFSLLWVCWWDARCPLLEKALLHMSHL
jgi:hypothetical protein